MNNYFAYTILKYKYSQILGEIINVGLLVIFADEVRFIYPPQLKRLRDFYPEVEEHHIKNYLTGFEQYANSISNNLKQKPLEFEESDFKTFAQKKVAEFLVKDDSALQFSELHYSVRYIPSNKKIVENLFEKFFFPYLDKQEESGKNEEYIIKTIRNNIKEIQPAIFEKYFNHQLPKSIENDKTSLTFDLHWQNGQTHLIKPISFDLKQGSSIDNKANRYFGKFWQLNEEISTQNYVLDIPLIKPSQKILFKEYDKAVRILEDISQLNLIEEEKLPEYTQKTIEALLAH